MVVGVSPLAGPQDMDLSSGSDSSFPKTQKRYSSHAGVLELGSSDGIRLEILTYPLFLTENGYEVVQG